MENNKKVAIVGLGYVGLPLALLAAEKGYDVIGVEISQKKIAELKDAPITVTDDFSAIKDAAAIIICVPTPVYDTKLPNLEPVVGACRSVAKYLSKGQLVVLESTVNPGVCETVALPILEKESGLKAGVDFYLAHCPERINPGDEKWTVRNIPRVVGALDAAGLKMAAELYRSIIDGEVKEMGSLKEAESVKIVENAFRDVNIAFVNELAMSFSKLGIDVVNVINGSATKPFAFMAHYPGAGVGGHCIPVDPYYLIDYAKQNGFNHEFLALARTVNNGMPKFAVGLAVKELEKLGVDIADTKVTVLGLAYKANIEDCRESPSFEIIEHLEEIGAHVTSYDPYVLDKSTAKTLEDALLGAKVVNHRLPLTKSSKSSLPNIS
ncbi:MAG: nucleotide sugar dehydrogenase [bacterium]